MDSNRNEQFNHGWTQINTDERQEFHEGHEFGFQPLCKFVSHSPSVCIGVHPWLNGLILRLFYNQGLTRWNASLPARSIDLRGIRARTNGVHQVQVFLLVVAPRMALRILRSALHHATAQRFVLEHFIHRIGE